MIRNKQMSKSKVEIKPHVIVIHIIAYIIMDIPSSITTPTTLLLKFPHNQLYVILHQLPINMWVYNVAYPIDVYIVLFPLFLSLPLSR